MFSAASLLTQTLLALSITGSPVEVRNSPITLPMTRKLKYSNGTNLVQRDNNDIFLENFQTIYCASVGVGDPPTYYSLAVDTGSAITWIGAHTPYEPTSTSVNTKGVIEGTYGSGSFTGTLFIDTVSFENGLSANMPIGVAFKSKGVRYDGILGIGPRVLSFRSLKNTPKKLLPTITEYLFAQDKISQRLVGLYFQPSALEEDDSGRLTFGGVATDPDFEIGDIAYVDTTKSGRSSFYWGIDQRITYGNTEILNAAGIVDCGSTVISLASDAFERYKAATGADLDPRNNILTITPEKYDDLRPLNFHIGGKTYTLTPDAQIWPHHLNYIINGDDDSIYLVVKSRPTGTGIDFVLGYAFLQRFYTAYDIANSRVGFATTKWTYATINHMTEEEPDY